jgi:hypothetical protein
MLGTHNEFQTVMEDALFLFLVNNQSCETYAQGHNSSSNKKNVET